MKKSFAIALSLLTITSTWADDLASLRQSISKMLAQTCDCSPISNEPSIGRLFTVKMRDGHGFDIVIKEMPFWASKDWTAKSRELKALLDKLSKAASTGKLDPKDVQSAMSHWIQLPNFSYKHIGLDIFIDYPEYASPENKKNSKISEAIFGRIQSLLTPYKEG